MALCGPAAAARAGRPPATGPRRRPGAVLATGLAAGVVADTVLADPRRLHPVAGFGRLAAAVERRVWAPRRSRGAAYVTALVLPLVAAAGAGDRRLRRRPAARRAYIATMAWAVLGPTSLHREAALLARSLADGDVPAARDRLPHLCGRDPTLLDEPALARATIESVAENTSDAVVAPLLWGAVAGPMGLVGYRAVNTLDAMVGHRSERYGRFGWAAARLDDAANLLPARLTAALAVLLAPLVGGRRAPAWRAWREDAPAHPSPNAGPCEAAFAGALGLRLGGPTRYAYGLSRRPWLGDGRGPGAEDIPRAVALSRLVGWSAAALCALYALARDTP
jgi:adenosylcobinamide-phosphate synthase